MEQSVFSINVFALTTSDRIIPIGSSESCDSPPAGGSDWLLPGGDHQDQEGDGRVQRT